MRRILPGLLCFVLISAVAAPLFGQCSGKGTFARRAKNGQIEYCWHGKHYTEATAPSKVRSFFAKAVAKSNAARKRDGGSQRTASQARTSRSAAASSVAASPEPVAAPVGADLFASIETGAGRDEVLAKLGKPHGSMSNLGEEGTEESWSYRLPDGGMAKVRLDRGKVIAIQLPR